MTPGVNILDVRKPVLRKKLARFKKEFPKLLIKLNIPYFLQNMDLRMVVTLTHGEVNVVDVSKTVFS